MTLGAQLDTTVTSQGGAIGTTFACSNDSTATMTGADVVVYEYVLVALAALAALAAPVAPVAPVALVP